MLAFPSPTVVARVGFDLLCKTFFLDTSVISICLLYISSHGSHTNEMKVKMIFTWLCHGSRF